MKKIFAAALLCTMVMNLFTGCSNSSETSSQTSSSGTSGQSSSQSQSGEEENIDIRIVSATTAGTVIYQQIEDLCNRYMEEHQNVNITFEGLSSGELRTKLSVEFAAGSPPDVS